MLQNDQIVTMDQLLATAKSEQRRDLAALATHDARGIAVGIGGDAARDFAAVGREHADGVARLKTAERSGDPGRQQALAALQRAPRRPSRNRASLVPPWLQSLE